jgi:hypothetical protein
MYYELRKVGTSQSLESLYGALGGQVSGAIHPTIPHTDGQHWFDHTKTWACVRKRQSP